jgi:hypothetical protein
MKQKNLLRSLTNRIDSLPFEQIENELTYNQLCRLHDAYRSFAHDSNLTKVNFKNKNLRLALASFRDVVGRYKEAPVGEGNFYDPLK